EHRVHIEPLAAAPQGLGYTGIDLEAELRRAFPAQVSRRSLIDVERHDVEAGLVPFAPDRVADQEAIAHVLRVAQIAPLRGDDGHFLAPSPRVRRRPAPRCAQRTRTGCTEECSSGDHHSYDMPGTRNRQVQYDQKDRTYACAQGQPCRGSTAYF